ncbi:DUF4224 domain-containing protein [Grimontia hollisae]|uniref:DUF4224 domain-containing protein n=1 Tax=Grimontia hollisae TaxID=673 RepID=UPI001303C7DC|nr:DUF4224 domain-containing protein [Grimontia hollisae]MDF2185873.1 DUF4224 domain-containing protein [Grimontia hollisae]
MSETCLTKDELYEVTGYQIPSQQYRVLREHGIFAIYRRPTNSVFTTWHHILNVNTQPIPMEQEEDEPDFGALNRA